MPGAPVTGKPENLAAGTTVAESCGAAIEYGDNTAANLLLQQLGGPVAVTGLCRSLGDGVTRLDRWEPELNSAEPGQVTGTTTPPAVATACAKLTVGHALDGAGRRRLTGRLLANTTGGERIRAGLPGDRTVGDKTGTGCYGTADDVALARPPGRAPLVVAVFSTHAEPPPRPTLRWSGTPPRSWRTPSDTAAHKVVHSRSTASRPAGSGISAMRPEPFCFDHELSYSDAEFSTERHNSFTGHTSLPAPRTRPDR
ncbi:serine hydrolase [Streptomyces sp900105755]|uniref:serine hydrolase n=1 Tax=Streptomyces sp. 900105755 TaxID=3154389 RepID=UPI0033302B34